MRAAARSTSPGTSRAPRSSTSTTIFRICRSGTRVGIRCRRRRSSPRPPVAQGSDRGYSSPSTARWAAPSGCGGYSATSAMTTAPSCSAGSRRGEASFARERRRSRRSSSSRVSGAATRSRRTRSRAGSPTRRSCSSTRARRTAGAAGRIPRAANAPWNEPLPELPPGELVAYCGSGVTSCVTLHRAWLAGREGRLYPGSWSEWSKRGLPLERG